MRRVQRPGKSLNSHESEMANLINEINNLEEGQFVKLDFESENNIKCGNNNDDECYSDYDDDNNNNDNSHNGNDTNDFLNYKFPKNLKCLNLEDYQIKGKIFENSFVKEYLITEKKTSNSFLSKIFINKKYFQQELNAFSQLNSDFIVKIIGYNQNDFKNKQRPTIITELPKNGSLHSILNFQKKGFQIPEFNDTKKLILIYGIASSMSYLHSQNIIHRNLKPSTVYIDEFMLPKVGDFEFSLQNINHSKSGKNNLIGTYAYMAPEVMTEEKYSKAGDVYSFSIIVYEILSDKKPFFGFNEIEIIEKVTSGYRPQIESNVPACYKELIEKCWSDKPQKRPTFSEIVNLLKSNSEFITESVNKEEFINLTNFIDNKSSKQQKNCESIQKVSLDLNKTEKIDEKEKIGFLNLSLFEKQRSINKGQFSKIYQVKNKKTASIYACKISTIEIGKLNDDESLHLNDEVKFISQMKHPSFLDHIGFSLFDFDKKRRPLTITEFPSNGSLKQLLDNERKGSHNPEWNDTKKLIVIFGIAAGMESLHSKNFLHKNLNPSSIFIDSNFHPKIGNFGLETRRKKLEKIAFQTSNSMNNDFLYAPPEFLKEGKYSKEGDVYSFSLIVYEILTNNVPFKDIKNLTILFNEVVKNSYRPKIENLPSKKYRDLIEVCWSKDIDNRPSFGEITHMLKTEFITENVNKNEFREYIQKVDNVKITIDSHRINYNYSCTMNNNENNEMKNENKQVVENVNNEVEIEKKNVEDENEEKRISKCCYLI